MPPMRQPAASPKTADALQRALAALQSRRADEAERIASEMLARNARHGGALHVLGLALLAQGRPREAAAPLEAAAGITADAAVETHWGMALRQSGQSVRALEVLQRATARERPPPLAFHELGVLLFSLRRLDEAQAVLERGLTLAPAMTELSVLLGGIFLDRADWANARLVFARALANAPAEPAVLFGLGAALIGEGEFAGAAERLRQAVARDGSYVQARLRLAACLLELDRREDALGCMRTAVQTAPRCYGEALHTLVSAGRGAFCLRPSAAAAMLRP
jgi:tetratricopeptide (TPR) repeat protein